MGVAANNLGGVTVHSLFSLGIHSVASFETCNWMKGEKRRLLNAIDVVIIDEVSTLRPDTLDAINWTLLKNSCDGLDTKQVIFVGDLAQLEAPINDNTRSVMLRTYNGTEFYHAKIYKKLKAKDIELDEVMRQSDPEFIHHLNIVRNREKSDYWRRFIRQEPLGMVLAPYNTTVEDYNKKGLDLQKGEIFKFEATVTGNAKADEFNLPSVIEVKNGCKIMYLANSIDNKELVNGTLGIFVSHKGCHYIRVDEVDYSLVEMEFTKKEYVLRNKDLVLEEIGTIRQYPFRPAYALSIHKSQGLTFKEVTVDLRRPCFQKGQLYVALSRVVSPEGLTIIV